MYSTINRANFKGIEIDSTCLLCGVSCETVEHLILNCPLLEEVRKPVLEKVFAELSEIQETYWCKYTTQQKRHLIIEGIVLLSIDKVPKGRIFQRLSIIAKGYYTYCTQIYTCINFYNQQRINPAMLRPQHKPKPEFYRDLLHICSFIGP